MIIVKTVDEVSIVLKNKIKKLSEQKALNEIGQYMVRRIMQRFDRNEIKPKTKRETFLERRAKGYKHIQNAKKESTRNRLIGSSITLVDTGALKRSITFNISESQDGIVYIGTNLEYAAIHQFGGKAGRNKSVKLPARPFLFFTGVDRIQIMRILKKYFEAAGL